MSGPAEFSRIVKVDSLPRDGLRQKIAANEAERAALAKRFGLDSIQSLEADFEVERSGRGGARVTGEARAKVMQFCVVTLEPFPAEVVEEVDLRFAPPDDPRRKSRVEEEIRFDAEDEPDPLIDGQVDLGEVAAEFIALGLDPYPRKPDAEFQAPEEDEKDSPFAGLLIIKGDGKERQ